MKVINLYDHMIDQSIEDIQEPPAFSHITYVLHWNPASYCRDICDGAQALCLGNWLGHEPTCCCLCCNTLSLYTHTHTHTLFVFEICLGNIDEVMRCFFLLLFQCLGDCDIEHLILCPRNSDKEERSSFCYCL